MVSTSERSSKYSLLVLYWVSMLTPLNSFGFRDGISQPIIEGWDEKVPKGKEPQATKPG